MSHRLLRFKRDEESESTIQTPRRRATCKAKCSAESLELFNNGIDVEEFERVQFKALAKWGTGDVRARRVLAVVVLTLLLFAFWPFLKERRIGNDAERGFVTVTGMHFVKDCRPFYIVGFNAHDAVTAARLTPSEYKMAGGRSGKEHVRRMFQEASSIGLSVARIWVHSDDIQFPFQVEAGQYDEQGFRALDYVIDEAGKYDVKLILSLIDSWKYYNGVDQYVDWSSTAPARTQTRPADAWGDPITAAVTDEEKWYEVRRRALFFSDVSCREMYKEHLKAITHRRNTLNGRLYKDDAAIMGWDLINEPRCETWLVPDCLLHLQKWIQEMSSFLKSLDLNHLVTIGSEGFFGRNTSLEYLNPQSWASELGQDFVNNHAVHDIDFATIHVWPDHWQKETAEFGVEWIESHIHAATELLQKPLLIEEFGKKVIGEESREDHRSRVFQSVYSTIEKSVEENKAIAGSLFWKWTLPMFHGSGPGEYGVSCGGPTFKLVQDHVGTMHRWMRVFPPCVQQCWMAHSSRATRSCRNLPEMCSMYIERSHASEMAMEGRLTQQDIMQIGNATMAAGRIEMYSSKQECCQPQIGAFPKGCAWWPWKT